MFDIYNDSIFLSKQAFKNKDDSSILKIEYNHSLEEFKYLQSKILEKNSIFNYGIADLHLDNTLVLLKDGDIGQLGIQVCNFCGMLFNNEDEKYIH